MAIFASYLKEKGRLKKDTVVATIMSNLGLKKFAEANKINFEETKVGDRYVLEKMLKEGYNLGGEQSGHIILLDYNPTGDGILTSLMLIQIMLEKNCKISKLCEVIKKYPQVLLNIKVNNDKKKNYENDLEIQSEVKKLQEEFQDNGRVLVRASGTEPIIRVMLEGENQKELEEKAQKLGSLIKLKLN